MLTRSAQEIRDGAWLVLDTPADVIIQDRVMDSQPGKPKPVWTELVQLLGDEAESYIAELYGD